MFKLIDKDNWKRKPYFDHYFSQIRCTYSITVNIDISGIIAFKNRKSFETLSSSDLCIDKGGK